LAYNQSYFWDLNVSDGTLWTNNTYVFTTIGNDPPAVDLPVPFDSAVDVSILTTQLTVLIMDNESDLFYAEINCSNGDSWSAEDLTDGFYSLNLTAPLMDNTTYVWWVNATDGYNWENKSYGFSTGAAIITVANETPTNSSVNVSIWLTNFSIDIDSSIGLFNYSITTNHYSYNISENNATNGTKTLNFTSRLLWNDTVVIFVNVSYYGSTSNTWYLFTTEEGNISIIYDPLPLGGSSGVTLILNNLSVNISDPDNDTLLYNITMGNQTTSGSVNNTIGGVRIYLNLSTNLTAATIYNWTVNITDGSYVVVTTYNFTTEMYHVDFTFTIVNLTVTFISNISDGLQYYIWNFGDGSISNKVNPVHTYQTGPYNYSVTLKAENETTAVSGSITKTVPILINTSVDTSLPTPLMNFDWGLFPYLAILLGFLIVIILILRAVGSIKHWWTK
jgi:hypothetical protein